MTSTQSRTRTGQFAIGTASSNDKSSKGFPPGFGNASAAWSNGNIWGKDIGSGLKNGVQDTGRGINSLQVASNNVETITGSRSLLPSSESDGFNLRHGSWKSIDETSPSLSRVHTNTSGTSPLHRQPSNQLLPPSFTDNNSSNPNYFSVTPGSTTISSRPSQKNFLDATSGNLVSGPFNSNTNSRSSRHNSDEDNSFAARKLAFEGNDIGLGMRSSRPSFNSNTSGYNSDAGSRNSSLPPSRNDMDVSTRHPMELQSSQYPRISAPTSHHPNLSAQAPAYTMNSKPSKQRYGEQLSLSHVNQYLGDFGSLNIGKENSTHTSGQSGISYGNMSGYSTSYAQETSQDGSETWNQEDNTYYSQQTQFPTPSTGSGSIVSNPNTRRNINYGSQYSVSPSITDTRLNHSNPYYSNSGTPPTHQHRTPSRGGFGGVGGALVTSQAAALDRKLRGIQEQQSYMVSRPTPMHFNQFPPATYDFHAQPNLRMNQLNAYYAMPQIPHPMATSIPRGPANDHPPVPPVRSALLEEFRNNSKTNKRYELKDIYNYIVEFSGDQHGSRFIQQKLETANSDEKDQVFRELHPNAIQLMTDVFGNYVIQKFFEHGNQSQKKVLANQMRTHIFVLSTQMYGCRVVQKALEHILTDQQAQLIKELEHKVLQCVKDQNGNHVVQKAIERIPAEHIQFILNSLIGQVPSLAVHPYGCRVIQRMLEHCEEPTMSCVLQEIHASASSLIIDQFGNYVAQHIIEHGNNEDRVKLIDLVISQLANFSKHKFASNVVEKSIQYGTKEQRDRVVATLTVLNERGESPSQSLLRDQYGNYVIQKVLNILHGPEREEFVVLVKEQLNLLKRFSYGKQIQAIEKILYSTPYPQPMGNTLLPPTTDTSAAPTPPLLTDAAQSPQSSSLPSPHTSSINAADVSRKSSGNNPVDVLTTPTST